MSFTEYVVAVIRRGRRQVLPGVKSARVERDFDAGSNILLITLDNYVRRSVRPEGIVLRENDIVLLFARRDGRVDIQSNDDLFGTFVFKNYDIDVNARHITAECFDRTYEMLARVAVKPRDAGPVNELVNQIVQESQEDGLSSEPTPTQIAATRSDGSAFPIVEYNQAFETAFQLIDRLSQTNFTGDLRPYQFFFDEEGTFVWRYPPTEVVDTFDIFQEPVLSIKTDRKDADVVSAIFFDAGEDANGARIVNVHYDPLASQIRGRTAYLPMTDIARDNPIRSGETNAQYRQRMEKIARARADAVINSLKAGLLEVRVELIGSRLSIGDFHRVVAFGQGLDRRDLKLERIVQRFDRNGWRSIVRFVEDPERVFL